MDDRIPLIRRFTGGGTVYVDHNIHFVSFILNKTILPNTQQVYPETIMRWTSDIYTNVFSNLLKPSHKFYLRENDYCIDTAKIGGNAQSIIKDRFIHVSYIYIYGERYIYTYYFII